MSTYPEPATDGFWCYRCKVHRTRTVAGLCPSCDDDRVKAARAAATPRRPAR